MIDVSHWKLVKEWRWPHFSPEEMACKGDNSLKLDETFMDSLEALRVECGFPFKMSSVYRSPQYNAKVSDTGNDGPHTEGKAGDITVNGARALRLVELAPKHGFTGVGIAQKGPVEKRYIHLDTCTPTPTRPRPWLYSY